MKKTGMITWRWEKPDRQANECLDTFIYCSAAMIKHGCSWISDEGWAKLEDELETPSRLAPGAKRIAKTPAQIIADQLAQ